MALNSKRLMWRSCSYNVPFLIPYEVPDVPTQPKSDASDIMTPVGGICKSGTPTQVLVWSLYQLSDCRTHWKTDSNLTRLCLLGLQTETIPVEFGG